MVQVVGTDRVRVQLDAAQVGHPGQRGRLARHDLVRDAPGREADVRDLEPLGTVGGRPLLEKELLADAAGVAHQDARPAAGPAQGARRHRQVVIDQVQLGQAGVREQDLAGTRDDDLVPVHLQASRVG